MSWTAPHSGKTYRLALLDTNVLSEIVKRPRDVGRGFLELLSTGDIAPCFTAYSLLEMWRRDDVVDMFIDTFSVLPIFLLKPQSLILAEELEAYDAQGEISPIFHVFSALGADDSYDLRHFMATWDSSSEFSQLASDRRGEEADIMDAWLGNIGNFSPTKLSPNKLDADRYVKEAGLQSLIATFPDWVRAEVEAGRVPDVARFPSLTVMLYSQYYRLYDPGLKAAPGEVTDVQIFAAAPYVEIAATERFQAELLNKIRRSVPQLREIQTLRISDLVGLAANAT